MSLHNINTSDPIALRYLMSETIFVSDMEEAGVSATDDVPGAQVKEHPKEEREFVFYGQNKSNYLFLTHEKQFQFMSDAALEAFTKTLAALKLASDDVAVLNLAIGSPAPRKDAILSFFKPKAMVFLGVAPETVQLDIVPLQTVAQCDGVTVFHTCTFDEMLTDGEKKRIFWTTLKTLLT